MRLMAVAACAATMLGGLMLTSVETSAAPFSPPAGVSDTSLITKVRMSRSAMMRRHMMMRQSMMMRRKAMMRRKMMRRRMMMRR